MITKVSNTRANQDHTRYIGRTREPFHYGNPFSLGKKSALAPEVKETREECILAFYDWLAGDARYVDVEPERRQWVLDNLENLRGQTLGCFCAPKACHGDVYRVFLGEITYEELLELVQPKPKQSPVQSGPSQGDLF